MTKGSKLNKKNAVTYRLVYNEASRYDDEAPKHILVPVSKGASKIPEIPLEPPVASTSAKTERVFPASGPQPNWDPDIVAGLDDDFDFEDEDNQLEEDFVTKANAADGSSINNDPCYQYGDDDDDVGSDIFGSDFSEEEDEDDRKLRLINRKSKSTNYSMTSAVTTCTEEVKAFNERFEKLFELYDDDQIGALECEEIEGRLSPSCEKIQELYEMALEKEATLAVGDYDNEMKNKILEYIDEEKPEEIVTIVTKKPVEFDCESILSTYSNIYNHPTLIKIDRKGQRRRLTKSNLKKLNKPDEEECTIGSRSTAGTSFTRPKDETPEERRLRKRVVKEARRENRAIKKENKIAFNTEKRLQDQQSIHARRNAGIKML